jgi:hypothetical protein
MKKSMGALFMVGMLAMANAHADGWRGGEGWRGRGWGGEGDGGGAWGMGAALVGGLVGGMMAQQAPVYAAPPMIMAPPPAYAVPQPAYAYPAPAYAQPVYPAPYYGGGEGDDD